MASIDDAIARLEPAGRRDTGPVANWLADRLPDLIRRFPEVRLESAGFTAHLASTVAPAADAPEALANLHLDDLYLAWACAEGDRGALERFDREHLVRVRNWARGADPAELEQVVRLRLLVSDSGRPARIRQYTGRGPLAAWVRMTATRAAIDLVRAARGESGEREHAAELGNLSTPVDPELDYLKMHYTGHCRAALERALRSLSVRQASLLKLCYLENASPAAIGRMYSVSPRTAQRWLAEAREHLIEQTRAALAEALSIPRGELDSLMLLVHSRLHISLQRMFQSTA